VPVLTVVTVVKDDPDGLNRTLASLVGQDLDDVEIVIVDGSADRDAAPAALARTGLTAAVIWSPPRGVYPAMNEGLAAVRGTYVYFLNAGDSLADSRVLAELVGLLRSSPDWVVGRVRFLAADGAVQPAPAWDYAAERRRLFARGRFPAHQGVVLATGPLRSRGGFDESYRVAADYAAILGFAAAGDPVVWDRTIADFQVGGLSTVQWRVALAEFHRARRSILRPRGSTAALEGWDTARVLAATALYRGLWAPGRPLHDVVRRLRPAASGG
jgi:glycosyltransferase involved in cell wall biosynthesis